MRSVGVLGSELVIACFDATRHMPEYRDASIIIMPYYVCGLDRSLSRKDQLV